MAEKKLICDNCSSNIEPGKIKIFRKEVSVAGIKINDIFYGKCPGCGEEIYLKAKKKGGIPVSDMDSQKP